MPGNRAFAVALVVSILLHVSSVTIFRVVIYFPREDINYFDVAIMDPRIGRAALLEPWEMLQVPSREGAVARAVGAPGESLPSIELPTLEFAELDLLRVRTQGLELRSRYRELFEREHADAWARFGNKLGEIGDALTRMAQGLPTREEAPRIVVSNPAPGFEAYLEWFSDPVDRQPILAISVKALWGLDPAQLAEPIGLVFKVNREGKVIYVLPQMEDDEGIVDSAARALSKYRFEALGEAGPEAQHGMLVIRASGDLE